MSKISKKKSLGQHFLLDEQAAESIARNAGSFKSVIHLLEVGSGEGVLTKYLLDLNHVDLKVVELDDRLAPLLEKRFRELKGRVIHMDFLRLDLEKVFGGPFGLVGNFPYNISSQIVFRMLEFRHLIPFMTGMFQREVGLRLAAGPGSKTYGVISVLTQAYYSVESLFELGPEAFDPPPAVHSVVLRFDRLAHPRIKSSESDFRRVVKSAFLQRRKKLRNALKPIVSDPALSEGEFMDLRAEQLSVEDFDKLTQNLLNQGDSKS